MNSSTFKMDDSEDSIKIEDLHLMNKQKLQTVPVVQRVYVGELQQIKKPFLQQIKPHLESFLAGAATTAGHAGTYSLKALSAIKGALWWSYEGIKGLFSKTAEYIQPKFVFITSKLQSENQQQIKTVQKIGKDIAVLGLDQYKELALRKDGKFQVAVPVDEQFLNFLRNQKVQVNQTSWEPNMETTKTIMAPSESFIQILQEMKSQKIEIKANNMGGFCTFHFQGENQIEYECIQKLKLGNNLLEGYIVPVQQRVNSVKSEESGPDSNPEAPLVVEREVEKQQQQKQQVPQVKSVQAVNLYPDQFDSEEMKMEFA